ncbi:uncharacterized protein METZ01_LOCUS455053, partial [marine metagenome]
MQTKEIALAALIGLSLISAFTYFLVSDEEMFLGDNSIMVEDPLLQEEGHDHMDASMHNMSSGNIEQIE